MKQVLVGLASLTLAVGAWGQWSVMGQQAREEPIPNCIAAMGHRNAILVHETHKPTSRGFKVNTFVFLHEAQNHLGAGYYQLQHTYWDETLRTQCTFRPLM